MINKLSSGSISTKHSLLLFDDGRLLILHLLEHLLLLLLRFFHFLCLFFLFLRGQIPLTPDLIQTLAVLLLLILSVLIEAALSRLRHRRCLGHNGNIVRFLRLLLHLASWLLNRLLGDGFFDFLLLTF